MGHSRLPLLDPASRPVGNWRDGASYVSQGCLCFVCNLSWRALMKVSQMVNVCCAHAMAGFLRYVGGNRHLLATASAGRHAPPEPVDVRRSAVGVEEV